MTGAVNPEVDRLVDAAATGDRSALARLLSLVERGGEDARAVGRATFPRSGGGYTVGLTGAPGAGKSTLTSALVAAGRARSARIAVLAIDPSSPFTGGAILGDRVRMSDHALDTDVFIRSMATRGHLGGLALATPAAVRVLDAAGYPWLVVETVGVGQVEVDIAGAADTTIVVVNPGWGDAVQANKAGLMEIADIFVVNKADRSGAEQTVHDIESMLDLTRRGGWRPPVLTTVSTDGTGADELWEGINRHRAHIEATGTLAGRRAERRGAELSLIVDQRLRACAEGLVDEAERERLRAEVTRGERDPWAAADTVLAPIERLLGTLHDAP